MAYHNWSSDWPYFNDVADAAWEIGLFLTRCGIGVSQTKEKFGECRVYVYFDTGDEKLQRAYRRGYERAVKKYPHIHDEILDAADWPEMLEGL